MTRLRPIGRHVASPNDEETTVRSSSLSSDAARLTRRSRITATFSSLDGGLARRRARGWSTRGRDGPKTTTWWRNRKKRDDDNANVSHYDKVRANGSSNRTYKRRTFAGVSIDRSTHSSTARSCTEVAWGDSDGDDADNAERSNGKARCRKRALAPSPLSSSSTRRR